MTVHHIEARVHGRYLVQRGGDDGLLVGFHGYGETADTHLRELQRIPGIERWTVAAVQALHPFYKGRSGDVAASWMTRQDRDLAIRDNLDYVASVVNVLPDLRPRVLIGFSQGVPMAYRAAAAGLFPTDGVIVIGGDVPPEIAQAESLSLPPVILARGSRDELYTDSMLKKDFNFIAATTTVTLCEFDGGHEWTDSLRSAIGGFLSRMTR